MPPVHLFARSAALAAALVLAACTARDATVCRADLPVAERLHLLVGHVRVNGTEVAAILDTGAEKSAVMDGLVTRLGLLADPREGSLMSGVGGEGTVQNDVLVQGFELAGFDPGDDHYPVIAIPGAGEGPDPVGALVGVDLLGHFDLELDLAHGRAALYDPDRCAGPLPESLPGWSGRVERVPLDVTWGGRLLLPVKVDGQTLTALLDSGSTATVIDLPAATRLGVTAAMLAAEPGGEGFGAAGVNFHRALHTFHSLQVGGITERSPRLSVLDRDLRESDMLLGLDWLRQRHVLISFRRHTLYIAPEGEQASSLQ